MNQYSFRRVTPSDQNGKCLLMSYETWTFGPSPIPLDFYLINAQVVLIPVEFLTGDPADEMPPTKASADFLQAQDSLLHALEKIRSTADYAARAEAAKI